jgi:hypothetical protein
MELDRELQTYRRELPRLLAAGHEGKFALVHGDTVDVFGAEEDAVQAGDERFGLEPFLVKQILQSERHYFVPFPVRPPCPS